MNMDILLLTVSIIIFLVIAAKPKIGVYLVAACLPIIGNNFSFSGFVIPVADFVALLTLGGFLTNLAYIKLFEPTEKIKLIWPIFFPFLMFFIANILSCIFANNPSYSFYYFLRWPFFLYFAYIFAPANIIKDPKTLKKTIVIVFLSTLVVLISGYLSLYGQDWQNSFFRMNSLYILGSYPFGDNHNLIAEFLNIGVFFVFVIKEFLKDKRQQKIADVIFILTAIGIILTFSRTGWITLILQLAIYLYYQTRHDPKKKMGAVMLILFSAVIISPLLWKMSVLQDSNTSSTDNRVLLTEISLNAFKDKPIFGQGSGEFINLVDNNIRFKAKYGDPIDSHGVLQKVLAENGLFGLAAWLLIMAYLIKFSLFAVKKYYPRVRWVLPFALAALGGIFFQFFNTSYYKGKVWFPLILFIIAIQLSEQRYDKKNKDTSHSA
jgi:hypothetical protein